MARPRLDVRATLNPHLSSFTVIEPFPLRRRGLRERAEGAFTTWMTLLTAGGTFSGFSKAQATEAVLEGYARLARAAAARDLLELSKLCAVPVFDLFQAHIEGRAALPFVLHDSPEAARLVAARTFKREADSTALSSWYQLYFRLWAADSRAQQLVVVERREADFDLRLQPWRFAHIEAAKA